MDLDEDTQLTCTGSGSGSGSDHGSLFPDSFLDPMYGMDDFIDPFRVWDNETSQNILPNFPGKLLFYFLYLKNFIFINFIF